MNEYYNYLKNYIIDLIVDVSFFNCKKINIKHLDISIDNLVKEIIKDWDDNDV